MTLNNTLLFLVQLPNDLRDFWLLVEIESHIIDRGNMINAKNHNKVHQASKIIQQDSIM